MGARTENRLGRELSPYLRQHAHNPVDWFPWGDEAIERARQEDKPILLSIGYSACHWCHVMERESFDDPAIGALMNELFVSIKVDREERPDLDQIYQLVVQLLGRSGGWPLTVFLTPALEPFFGGTYFPPQGRFGMPGFPDVLRAVSRAYHEQRDEIRASAGQLTEAIAQITQTPSAAAGDVPADVLDRAATALRARFDVEHGGFGGAPKFPNTMNLDVLLRAAVRTDDPERLECVHRTLLAMRAGGIYDQLGGGFHRYSVDERWAVPHFEKMLYDNALLARLYVDAFRVTGDAWHAETARETLEYVLREMRDPSGGFYSTQDADSEGEEGRFFVFRPEELDALLEPDDARIAALHYGVRPGGNFEHGATVLSLALPPEGIAEQLKLDPSQVRAAIARIRTILFEAREKRTKPFRDEKIIASWNGLAIGALAEAGGALGEERFLDAARGALAFVRDTLFRDGTLLRIAKDGHARVDAFLEDYADLAGAALDVYEMTFDEEARRFARTLVDRSIEAFWDEAEGGFFFAPEGSKHLLVRAKDSFDNAVPSGTSGIAHALLRLHAHTGEESYLERAEHVLRSLAPMTLKNPFGFGHLVGAMDRYVNGPTEIVFVGDLDHPSLAPLLAVARRAYVPNRAILHLTSEDAANRGLGAHDGRPTAYVCRQRTCSPPAKEASALEAILAMR